MYASTKAAIFGDKCTFIEHGPSNVFGSGKVPSNQL